MDQEALAMYASIVKNPDYQMGGRIRVNMGNMFAKRGQWTEAIKQYRMALDQIPTERQVRSPEKAMRL
jgi:intraflagellar transport protein 88